MCFFVVLISAVSSLLYFPLLRCALFFFFNGTATTEIYTLSLHDALPIFSSETVCHLARALKVSFLPRMFQRRRSEEHTSELQSLTNLVCRLLLEKKKQTQRPRQTAPTRTSTPRATQPSPAGREWRANSTH